MTFPYRLANGAGNPPDAAKFLANYDYLNSLLLNNLIMNGGMEFWTVATSFTNPSNSCVVADNWKMRKSGTSDAAADVTRESTTIDTGTYSCKVNLTSAGSANSLVCLDQTVLKPERFAAVPLTCGFRIRTATGSKTRVRINDGVSSQYSDYHNGDGTFQTLYVSLTPSASLTAITVSVEITGDWTGAVYVDGGWCYITHSAMTTTAKAFLDHVRGNDGIAYDNGDASIVSINGSFISGLRNRLINGDMRIDQRSSGSAVTVNSTTVTYAIDRWLGRGEAADGVFTITRSTSTPPTGFDYFLRATVTTADASIGASQHYNVRQRIEGTAVKDLVWGVSSAKPIVISFMVRSSVTGTFSGVLLNSAGDRCFPFTYAIAAASTWERKIIQIVGDSTGTWLNTNGIGIEVLFDLGSGSTVRGTAGAWSGTGYRGVTSATSLISTNAATWDITAVQFEVGYLATSFEHWPETIQQMLCERYYELGGDSGSGLRNTGRGFNDGTNYYLYFPYRFRVKKRATPTVTATWLSLNEDTSAADNKAAYTKQVVEVTLDKFNTSADKAVAGNIPARQNLYWVADAEL